MSRGPGKVEKALTELFSRLIRADQVFTVRDLCCHVFGVEKPTRVQRISVLRAAHRVISRARSKNRFDDLATRCRVTERADGTVVFHDSHYPVRVWGSELKQVQGAVWTEVEIVSIKKWRVTVRYQGEEISLERRELAYCAVWYDGGVRFISERNGAAARQYE